MAFFLTHWITKKITRINSEHGIIGSSIIKVEVVIDEIRRDVSYLKGSIDIIKAGKDSVLQSQSPISLTDIGKNISTELGAQDIVISNWDKIYAVLEEEICDKNAYDIQQYCIETAAVEPEKFLSQEDLAKVKRFAFEKGNSYQYYSGIFGILIRDKYLSMKGIKTSEIDDNDPTKPTKI